MSLGDILVLMGLFLTLLVYRLERVASSNADVDSMLATLAGVRDGMEPWGALYFSKDYTVRGVTEARSEWDFRAVMDRNFVQVFRVPTEPLAGLVEHPGERRLLQAETIRHANITLWQLGKFNQLVELQEGFHAQHIAEIKDERTDPRRLRILAETARDLSGMLHRDGIGSGEWYQLLREAIEENIGRLNDLATRGWFVKLVTPPRHVP